jgi:hypothetical protein
MGVSIENRKRRIGAHFTDRDVEQRNLEALQRKNSGPMSAAGPG